MRQSMAHAAAQICKHYKLWTIIKIKHRSKNQQFIWWCYIRQFAMRFTRGGKVMKQQQLS